MTKKSLLLISSKLMRLQPYKKRGGGGKKVKKGKECESEGSVCKMIETDDFRKIHLASCTVLTQISFI